AMIRIDQELRDRRCRARMLLQIHDELVFEAPAEEVPDLAELVRRQMTTALDLKVPLKVDLATGTNWLDVAPLGPESLVRGRSASLRMPSVGQPKDGPREPGEADRPGMMATKDQGLVDDFFRGIGGDPLPGPVR